MPDHILLDGQLYQTALSQMSRQNAVQRGWRVSFCPGETERIYWS